MNTSKLPYLQIATILIIFVSAIGCEKEPANLGSDVINPDVATNFNIINERYNIKTFNQNLGPVQSDALGLNTLGIYDDAYGRTTSSFVTQISPSAFNPDFGENTVLDSVVLSIPYFSRVVDVDEDGNFIYALDSVIGSEPINLRLFESNYFLRDIDPNGDFDATQTYFSNRTASESEVIPEALLESTEIGFVDYDEDGNVFDVDNTVEISNDVIVLTEPNEEGEEQVSFTLTPGLRVKLDPDFWESKIIEQEGNAVLSGANPFNEYFRGLYFKVEPNDSNDGSFLILDLTSTNANITLYYTEDNPSDDEDADETRRASYQIRFGPNRVNFMDNNFNLLPAPSDPENGNSRLYLKGGQGSLAQIQLFNGEDLDDDPALNTFEFWKNQFVETDNEGNFIRSKRLVNEANLIFYVDPTLLDPDNEPDRLYLYDIENNSPLVDYFLDNVNNSLPSFSIINHLGPLQRVDDEPSANGVKYKFKITEHINNLLLRDSTNVDLGLAVSINVNLEEFLDQRDVQGEEDLKAPISSIITPRGTILHGSETEDESKRVYLEIYYTEPD